MTWRLAVPAPLLESQRRYFGESGRCWVDALPALAAERLAAWSLRPDGDPRVGAVALVLPVLRADGTKAALKLQPVDEETVGEPDALRRWAGLGAVALLEHDPVSGSILLERLNAERSLAAVTDDLAALSVIAGLLRSFHTVQAPAGLRRLADLTATMLGDLPALLPRLTDPDERALLTRSADRVRELLAEPVADRLLHWDLHYDNVLAVLDADAGARATEPRAWRAIDPKPLSGDPGFDLLPALWNRWDDVVATGDVAGAVGRRFDLMVEVLELDPGRARTWTLARVLQNARWELASVRSSQLVSSHRVIAEALLR
ncbi:aminoglycoside phosphotransferase family protein [uncultured Friedmanniella sp.]|uniref:aminoglycoside phosphotransferase family protein n=1 Tax=uncultured Friedmanniella sp. TaxID=335381 RepID=UPI0035C9CBCD